MKPLYLSPSLINAIDNVINERLQVVSEASTDPDKSEVNITQGEELTAKYGQLTSVEGDVGGVNDLILQTRQERTPLREREGERGKWGG